MGRMRAGAVGALLILAAGVLVGCGTGPAGKAGSSLETRKFTAGAVEVTVEPVTLDSTGARIKVSLDTHSGDLGADLAKTSTLEVGGRPWGNPSWSGDGPGGHHRQGELRFQAAGAASGGVRLTIGGLPVPVTATWSLPAAS